MCGIAGETFYRRDQSTDKWVREACHLMAHRGPDGDGFYCDDGVAFGHRRLAIIDLSPSGRQPMAYADGRYWLTFNGEIYNYRELRQELSEQGCAFTSASDSEVILAAFAAWGTASFRRLMGIFAFGLWDAQQHTLYVVRDHLGVKPLLYHHDDEGLRFASELKALLIHPRVKRQIDPCALQDYLSLGYVLSPRTLVKDIYKLPAGHYLEAHDGQVESHEYWNLANCVNSAAHDLKSEQQYIEALDAELKAVVQQQMVSDVPLGAFLSGGIDSSAITYYATRHSTAPLKTFSIGFDEASYSELEPAQFAGQRIGSQHFQQVVKPLSLEELSKLVWYYDEPLGDTSLIPTYFVSRLARDQVTVALSGDGGDELFAGYDTYLADRLRGIYAHVPSWMRDRMVKPLVARIPSSYRKVSLDFKIKQFVQYAAQTAEQAHFGWRLMFSPAERSALTQNGNGYSTFDTYAGHYADVDGDTDLVRALYVDIKTWLVDDILTKVDRASMAVSLEARVPFLDPRFVEFAMSIPPSLKLKGFQRKYILKQAMRSRLPDEIIDRTKRGFNAPISLWMRDSLREGVDTLFRDHRSTLVDLHSPDLRRIWQEHCSGQFDHGFKLWTLLSLVLWEQQVLRGN